MEMKGEQLVPAPQQKVWEALNDPQVLKACIPGCETIDRSAENEYMVAMVSRVGPVSAKFKGKLTLSDVRPPDSYSLSFEGQGGPAGFAKGGASVRLSPEGSSTRLSYDVKANVGGKLAQIGSRLIDAAAKKVADDFFRNFNERLSASPHDEDPHAQSHKEREHGQHQGEEHRAEPVPRDPDLPQASDTTLRFFAAGVLVVCAVSLLELFG
jgi:carbon monoxide dehydrogenase subunit G